MYIDYEPAENTPWVVYSPVEETPLMGWFKKQLVKGRLDPSLFVRFYRVFGENPTGREKATGARIVRHEPDHQVIAIEFDGYEPEEIHSISFNDDDPSYVDYVIDQGISSFGSYHFAYHMGTWRCIRSEEFMRQQFGLD